MKNIFRLTLLACMISGCRQPQRLVKTERAFVHDSVYIDRWHTRDTQNDTVFIHDSVRVFKTKVEKDTVVDTVYVRQTVKEKSVAGGSKCRFGVQGVLLAVLCVIFLCRLKKR